MNKIEVMKKMYFYPKDGRDGVLVNSLQDIRNYMGELGYNIGEIDIQSNGLVIGYMRGQGVTLGQLKEDC